METKTNWDIEIQYCEIMEIKKDGVVIGWQLPYQSKIPDDQKTLHVVEVKKYTADGECFDYIEDHEFETWEEADAKITELKLKYPGAEVYDD
jgi:hypothetical protein